MIGLIAISSNYVVSFNKEIPWQIPEYIKLRDELTTGNIVIMGHNTYRNMYYFKPTNNRINIVMSSSPSPIGKEGRDEGGGLFFCKTMREVYSKISEYPDKKVYVIGGKQIYELFKKEIKEWIVFGVPMEVDIKLESYIESEEDSSSEGDMGYGLFDDVKKYKKIKHHKPEALTVPKDLFDGKKRTFHIVTQYASYY